MDTEDKETLKHMSATLDELLAFFRIVSKPPSKGRRIVDGLATGAGIMGILSVVDIIKTWIGG